MSIVSNLSRFWKQAFVGGITLFVLNLTAPAQILTGTIDFAGTATLDAPLGGATGFSTISGIVLGGQTGDFSSVPDYVPVTFTPFTFNPAPPSSFQFWTFTANSIVYSFDISSISSYSQNANFLNLSGTGVAHATGYSNASAMWTITDTSASGASLSVTFGSSVDAVPEPSVFAFAMVGFVACSLILKSRFSQRPVMVPRNGKLRKKW